MPDFKNILVDTSRFVADMVVDQVGTDQSKMSELYRLATCETGQLAMRAARAFDLVDEKNPGMADPFLTRIRQGMKHFDHTSVIRCFLRTLVRHPIPDDENELGEIYQQLIDFMMDQKKSIGIRYYGIIITYKIACHIPDLRFELFALYDEIAMDTGRGLKYRAKHYKRELIKKFGAE